jgi:flagellar protein FlbT
MALKIALKPHEKLIISGAVIVNGGSTSELLIENNVPLLRGKDIMSLADADSPCRRVYFAIQLMYVDEKNLANHHKTYWELVKEIVAAAPSTRPMFQKISEDILHYKYYQALKAARKLIDYEQEVMTNVRRTTSSL